MKGCFFKTAFENNLVSSIFGLTNLHHFENTLRRVKHYTFSYIWSVFELQDNKGVMGLILERLVRRTKQENHEEQQFATAWF